MVLRVLLVVLLAVTLAACGGSDDSDDNSPGNDAPASTAASDSESSDSESTEASDDGDEPTATTESSGDSGDAEGVPTHSDPNFPDVRLPLAAGSTGEVGSQDPNPMAAEPSRSEASKIKITINEIMDPAEIEGAPLGPDPGTRWYALNVTAEATGSETANTGWWTLMASDGLEYESTVALGNPPDLTYGSLEAGTSKTGVVVFAIPEDVTVEWVKMSPTIFAGENLIFLPE